MKTPDAAPLPLWLVAELTYQCPLHCPFCSNPVDFARAGPELSTEEWLRVLREARALGAVQLGLTGGEPLSRKDLEIIVAEARRLGFYSNLITSGVGLNETRIRALKQAGLDHIQLSFQDSSRELNDFLSSSRTFDRKRQAAALIKSHDFPMVMNCVIHRLNIEHVGRIIELAMEIGAEFLELANTQFYGWAYLNRDQLMPDRNQLQQAEQTVAAYREKLGDRLKIYHVISDYFENRPKRCQNGWGNTFIVVTPDGTAMPCHAARVIKDMKFPSLRTSSVEEVWRHSDAFNRFRGDAWMPPLCRDCPEKSKDLGGCRCQAFLLTGKATATDPVCDKSPDHDLILEALRRAGAAPGSTPVFRSPENSERYADS